MQKSKSCAPSSDAASESIILKVMLGFHKYGSDNQNDYVEEAKSKILDEEKLRVACVLQPEDTVDIYKRGAVSIKVLEPQDYGEISILDRNHFMFSELNEGEDGCAGLFSRDEDHGGAVSGSGSDVWYKFAPELVEFCKEVDMQARALIMETDDPITQYLESEVARFELEETHVQEEIKAANAVLDELFAKKEKTVGEVLAAKKAAVKRKVEHLVATGKLGPAAGDKRKRAP